MPESIPEMLQVFVSSTITECAAERAVARRAIESLNHDPILFEHIGARSTSPRELYLGKLEQSDIFVGIYRNSYGWVSPGSSVSGIEDELRRSGQRGMPRLIYLLEPAQDRDPRLSAMVKGVQSEITFSRFRHSEELYQRLREDIEAEVTKRFHEAERLEAVVHTDAVAAISGLVPSPKALLIRQELTEQLVEELSKHHVLQVSGELGIGKTVFLATVAKEKGFLFVSATQLGNHELATVLVNKLASSRERDSRYFAEASAAYSALLEEWRVNEKFTLVIDDCPDPDFIASFLKNARDVSDTKQLIYSVRNPDSQYGHTRFIVPPLSTIEAADFLEKHGRILSSEALEKIYRKSSGNPLYLLYFSKAPEETGQDSLSEYELDAWRKLSPLARELVSYLVIGNLRISLTELLALVGRRGGFVEEVADALRGTQIFVTEFPNGYTLRHEHQRTTIRTQLLANPSKFAYYSDRVARILTKRGDYSRAFFILSNTDKAAAEAIARPALFDAQRRGDFKSQLVIIEVILKDARRGSDTHDLILLLLSKAQALFHMGFNSDLEAVFTEIESMAATSKDPELKLRAREARETYSAATTLSSKNLELLLQLEQEYLTLGDRWSAGRLTTELSVLYTRMKRFPESLAAAERGLNIFQKLEDNYGISISVRNIASALAAIPGRENEATAMIDDLRAQQEITGTQRERAWLCNYMVRTLRRKKEFTEALSYGREAVRIGEELGDLQLTGSNRINVGNVFRDMGNLTDAIAEYSSAGELGRASGDRTLEASAARLSAAIYRRQDNNRLALEHAQLAVGLVEGTLASIELADAFEELGDCHYKVRNWGDAAVSYAKAASITTDIDERSRLTIDALSTCIDKGLSPQKYLSCLDLADQRTATEQKPFSEALFDRIDEMLKSVAVDHAIRLFGLHFRMMFDGLPPVVARFLFGRVTRKLLTQDESVETWRLLFPVMPLLASVSEDGLPLPDMIQLGDRLQDRIHGLHFKPNNAGASWVISLSLRQTVILTLTCLDDRKDTFTAAALLALFFKGFEKQISETLAVPEIPKCELDIYVGNIESVPADVRSRFPKDFTTCVVTRPTQLSGNTKYLPTFVVCREDLGRQWRAGTGSSSAVQGLLAEVLIEVVYQLLKGEVDLDVLQPKVVEIVRETIS